MSFTLSPSLSLRERDTVFAPLGLRRCGPLGQPSLPSSRFRVIFLRLNFRRAVSVNHFEDIAVWVAEKEPHERRFADGFD